MSDGIFDPSVTMDAISDIIPTDTLTDELNITELSSDTIGIVMVVLLLSIIILSYGYNYHYNKNKEVED